MSAPSSGERTLPLPRRADTVLTSWSLSATPPSRAVRRCLASVLARLIPGLRLGRLVHASGFDIRPSRPTLEPSDLVALGINRSPKLGHFPKQLQHQIFEFGMRKAVKVGRRHSQSESDSGPLVNPKIVPPRLWPLLQGYKAVIPLF